MYLCVCESVYVCIMNMHIVSLTQMHQRMWRASCIAGCRYVSMSLAYVCESVYVCIMNMRIHSKLDTLAPAHEEGLTCVYYKRNEYLGLESLHRRSSVLDWPHVHMNTHPYCVSTLILKISTGMALPVAGEITHTHTHAHTSCTYRSLEDLDRNGSVRDWRSLR
jgi:hypothetical protein